MKKKKISKTACNDTPTKQFITQPISQPDSRQEGTDVAMPNDANVERNKDWVDENKK